MTSVFGLLGQFVGSVVALWDVAGVGPHVRQGLGRGAIEFVWSGRRAFDLLGRDCRTFHVLVVGASVPVGDKFLDSRRLAEAFREGPLGDGGRTVVVISG